MADRSFGLMESELVRRSVLGVTAATVIGTVLAAPSGAASAFSSRPAVSDGAVVTTDKGPVRGTVTGGYRAYEGIPYAAPPVGRLRWVAPQPVKAWTTVRDATKP